MMFHFRVVVLESALISSCYLDTVLIFAPSLFYYFDLLPFYRVGIPLLNRVRYTIFFLFERFMFTLALPNTLCIYLIPIQIPYYNVAYSIYVALRAEVYPAPSCIIPGL